MTRRTPVRKAHARREAGFTVVEVVVAISLLTAIVAVFGPVMTSSFNSTRVTTNESRALDEIRNAVARVDRELRSAECIDAPAAGTTGSVLTFTTYADDTGEQSTAYEVTYSVDEQGYLTRTVGGDTTSVGEGIVVTSEEFHQVANAGERATVSIDLQVRFEDDHSPRRISTEIAARNAWKACP